MSMAPNFTRTVAPVRYDKSSATRLRAAKMMAKRRLDVPLDYKPAKSSGET